MKITGCNIPGEATIGEGTTLSDGGEGIHISPRAIVRNHVRIEPYVRLGDDVIVEDYAEFRRGCRIKGPVTVKRGEVVRSWEC